MVNQKTLQLIIDHINQSINTEDLESLTDSLGEYIETAEVYRVVFLFDEDQSLVTTMNKIGYRSFSKSIDGIISFLEEINVTDLIDSNRHLEDNASDKELGLGAFLYKATVTGYCFSKIAKKINCEINYGKIIKEDEILVIDPELINDVKLLGAFPVERRFTSLIKYMKTYLS